MYTVFSSKCLREHFFTALKVAEGGSSGTAKQLIIFAVLRFCSYIVVKLWLYCVTFTLLLR